MAGPGGGPPRRSHTKSRKGCETCKRRHIRCDENFPQWYVSHSVYQEEIKFFQEEVLTLVQSKLHKA
jgi:hypothetical protein